MDNESNEVKMTKLQELDFFIQEYTNFYCDRGRGNEFNTTNGDLWVIFHENHIELENRDEECYWQSLSGITFSYGDLYALAAITVAKVDFVKREKSTKGKKYITNAEKHERNLRPSYWGVKTMADEGDVWGTANSESMTPGYSTTVTFSNKVEHYMRYFDVLNILQVYHIACREWQIVQAEIRIQKEADRLKKALTN